jgi:fructokinase
MITMNKTIALTGEILVDLVISNDMSISNDIDIKPCPGGSVFNTANTLAKLGTSTEFFSRIGDDYWGKYLSDFMQNEGIGCSGIVKSSRNKTPLAFASVDQNGNASYDFYKSKFDEKMIIPEFGKTGIFHFGSFFSIIPENTGFIDRLFLQSKKYGFLTSYDPNYRNGFEKNKSRIIRNMKRSDIIKASIDDINNIFGINDLDSAFEMLDRYCPVLSIITLGKEGAAAKLAGQSTVKISGKQVKVVDTIGAGDNFSAGYLHYLFANGIFDKATLQSCNCKFMSGMLDFASDIASESLKIKGANIVKEKLSEIKAKHELFG